MAATATAQLIDVHRELNSAKARAMVLASALKERDEAVASALDAVVALLLAGDLSQSERWQMAHTLTNARALLDES